MSTDYGIKYQVADFTRPADEVGDFGVRTLLEQLRYSSAVEMQEGGPEFTIWFGKYSQGARDMALRRSHSFSLHVQPVERRA